jgi:glycosyltransferase involved in cell wall biosynthesis
MKMVAHNVLINALASTAGGGVTFLHNVLPRLAASDPTNHYLVLVPAQHLAEHQRWASERVRVESAPINGSTLARIWWEQTGLRSLLKARQIDVLISMGNFALLHAPTPQILFNGNDLYFSGDFERDLRARGLPRAIAVHRLKSRLAKASIKQADINVTPTRAFTERIRTCDGLSECHFEVLPFGFDAQLFTADSAPLAAEQLAKLDLRDDCYRLLYVSHYNYFRNFETLLRALPLLKQQLKEQIGKRIQLVLTTDITRGAIYGGYDATTAAELIDQLGVRTDIAMLGSVPYNRLHQLYRQCHVSVCPSYSESFGYPLVEAMAAGVPVAAANLPVHLEICGEAAVYFDVFNEGALAAQCLRLLTDAPLRAKLIERGHARSRQFSWDEHVRRLIELINAVALARTRSAYEAQHSKIRAQH